MAVKNALSSAKSKSATNSLALWIALNRLGLIGARATRNAVPELRRELALLSLLRLMEAENAVRLLKNRRAALDRVQSTAKSRLGLTMAAALLHVAEALKLARERSSLDLNTVELLAASSRRLNLATNNHALSTVLCLNGATSDLAAALAEEAVTSELERSSLRLLMEAKLALR